VAVSEFPESNDPRAWLHALDELESEVADLLEWHASVEIDGEPATFRRAFDVILGVGPPMFVDVGLGQVVELHQGPAGDDDGPRAA
jgi:hypothetical protein